MTLSAINSLRLLTFIGCEQCVLGIRSTSSHSPILNRRLLLFLLTTCIRHNNDDVDVNNVEIINDYLFLI